MQMKTQVYIFEELKSLKYWHNLLQEVAEFHFLKFQLIRAEWVICFNQAQVIRLNMGITGWNMMAYGMQKVRADDITIPAFSSYVKLWTLSYEVQC